MSFESAFRKISKGPRSKKNRLYLGDTEVGRRSMSGVPDDRGDAGERSGSYNLREYRQNPGASKGRGFRGGIRK